METERKDNSSRINLLIRAAEESRYNARHWLRYLRKQIKDGKAMLTKEDIATVIEKGQLTMYQKVSLKRAMESGTPTNRYIVELNQRAKTKMLDQIMRKYKDA